MGQLIEFYHPSPKPSKPVVEEAPEEQMPATEVLQTLLARAESLRDVLVIMRDDRGVLGLVSNLEGMPEVILLIEQTKLRMLKSVESDDGPKGIA